MQENELDREVRLRELASKLFFTLRAEGSRFALCRDVDVSKPVRHDGLKLDEAEDTWKLRGPHGGVAEAGRHGSSNWMRRRTARHMRAVSPHMLCLPE